VMIIIVAGGIGVSVMRRIVTGETHANVTNSTDTKIIQQDQDDWNEPTEGADFGQLNHIKFVTAK
jgi:hypothetical protein